MVLLSALARPYGGELGLTTASRGQLNKSEDGVVGWDGLEGDVRVPANLSVLLLHALVV